MAATVRVQLAAGPASPGKLGQALGGHGINLMACIGADNRASPAQRIVAGTARSIGIEVVEA